jgi:S1 RNA binding domain protein
MQIELGSVVEGVVTGITNFGAFVELPGGETGLVHISEIAEVYVKDINDYLKTNDKVTVKVISVVQKGKVGLSIKKANPTITKPQPKKVKTSFEDKMAKFLKESEERQQVLKRSNESRRGSRASGRRSV